MNAHLPGPARSAPPRQTLDGRFARLEPLDEARHGADIWAAVSGHDAVWTWLAYGPWGDEQSFRAWLRGQQQLVDPYYYAIVDVARGKAMGCATLMRADVPNGVIETGHIFFAPALQKTPAATETIYLFARHVFDDLGYRRFEWKCDNGNAPSRAAAARFGFTYEGLFRQHMIVRGRNRDTAWFSMLDSEWPARKAAFEAWLAPDNFDAQGAQRAKLSAFS